MSEGGYEPLLSSDETDALLQAMRNGAPGGSSSAKEVELGSADQRLRKSLSRADDVAREWAVEVRKIFRRMLGISASVRETTTDIVPYSVSQQAVAPGSCVCVLKAADGSPCFLLMGPGLTGFVLNRRLGGGTDTSAAPVGEDMREFLSPLDRRIVRPFCEEVLQAMCAIWGSDQVQLSIVELLGRPIDMPRLGQFEPLLRLPLTVNFGLATQANEELTLLFSGNSINSPHTEEAPAEAAPMASGDRALMLARLSFAELELVAVLGHAQSTVRNVLSLNVGDVLRLDEAPSSPLTVFIEGQKKMIGVPVVSHGNIAVEVTQMVRGEP
ncbi:MAG TPA: FliM/FliN family flagellar motor switch protein [Polyangiales bacterium]